jgi:GntR family transcriptional repressor for pyruvate dehydrogenase complex
MRRKNGTGYAIVKGIKQDILSGILKPGDRLPTERSLAERYGVSRIPVREAMKTLASMGLTHTRHGSGSFVRDVEDLPVFDGTLRQRLEAEVLQETIELRKTVEVEAVRLACRFASERDMAHIESAAKRAAVELRKREQGTPDGFDAADFAFHLAIARAGGNPLLAELLSALKKTFAVHQYLSTSLSAVVEEATDHHSRILSALRKRDEERAALSMSRHIERVGELLAARLRLDAVLGGP